MRQSLIGTGIGLALGLGAGGVIGFVLGSMSSVPEAHPASESSRPEFAADTSTTPIPTSEPPGRRSAVGSRTRRPERSRVAPPPPRERPTETAQVQPEPDPGRDAAALLHDVAAALRSDRDLTAEHVNMAHQLTAATDARPVDLSLVDLALSRSTTIGDYAHQIAFALAGVVAPGDAFAALESAVAADDPARLLVVVSLATRAALAGGDTSALARALLAHENREVRSAGITLATLNTDGLTDALLAVARTDADDEVRGEALWALLEGIDWENPDDADRARATPIALLAAREGHGDVRYSALSWFPELGPVAADTALEIIRDGGLDEELLAYVISPVLAAGRYSELLEADDTARVVRAAGWWLASVELEVEVDERRVRLPLTNAVLRLDDDDLTYELLFSIGYGGELAELERIAGDRTLPGRARATAASVLFSEDLDADHYTEAERRGLRALRSVLDPAAAGADTRRRAIESFTEWGMLIQDPATLSGVHALLRQVALGDPNTWVREEAAEALEYLADEE